MVFKAFFGKSFTIKILGIMVGCPVFQTVFFNMDLFSFQGIT
ncbi:hypothetical protein GXY_13393 [Novacetimonas hansenii ATCC 23769]|uniref:Uncharacterized protein n=1 Tax=Novacetimonas hansenii ATCC 23769 TaxID=714995 RepID=D5QHQ0_NOVHA|nr:hypothetical protein GXY_13393 [Novacetimonas hansenii ATCC 23769]